MMKKWAIQISNLKTAQGRRKKEKENKNKQNISRESTEKVPRQLSLGSEGVWKQKTGDNVIDKAKFQPQETAELSSFGHLALTLLSREGDYWDNWCWSDGAKKLAMIKRDHHH